MALFLLLFLVCPLTESVGNLDNFPRGGQDFELSFFLLLTLLCMSLLAALGGRDLAKDLLAELPWEPHDLWTGTPLRLKDGSSAFTVWVPPRQPSIGGSAPLPLRI